MNDFNKHNIEVKYYNAQKVVLATGRYGGLFLNKLSSQLGIEYEKLCC